MSEYIYNDIRKEINGDVYQIGYMVEHINTPIRNNNYIIFNKEHSEPITLYFIYKNGKPIIWIYGQNLSKDELIERFENSINNILND